MVGEMDRDTRSRLKNELVIWIVTAGKDRRPHAVPVWFWWDGKTFLIYAVPGQKTRNVRENPYVELHLNSDEAGNDVVRVEGKATILRNQPATRARGYLRKYGGAIKDLDMTAQQFSDEYNVPIRVRPTRFH
jgi:PPOX class probable F420-dependent enzyme